MDKADELVRIFTGTEIDCLTLKAELEKVDVLSMIKNEFQQSIGVGFAMGSLSTVELYIYKSEIPKAAYLIEEFNNINPEK